MINLRSRKSKINQGKISSQSELSLSVQAACELLTDNYRTLGIEHAEGVWNKKHLKSFDVMKFRGDNVYVWQTRMYQEINYFVSYLYALKVDKLELHTRLRESGQYGAETFKFARGLVSRDLIDSIIELNYLEEKLHLSTIKDFHILDIGAGYGRFARRIQEGFKDIKVSCIDAIPLSTCLSRVYLDEYIQGGQVDVHQLDTIQAIPKRVIGLAVNIHSFSEMSIESVQFWVDYLVAKEIEYLFIVPNGPGLTLNDGSDFGGVLEKASFHIIGTDDKYSDIDFSKFCIYPSKYYLLRRDLT